MKKFKMIDEEFTCVMCKNTIKPLGYSARDHCNICLCSLHVDNNPGDRQNSCHGVLKPIAVEKAKKDQYKIIYQCLKCKAIKKNIVADDDSLETILEIMKNRE